VSRFPGSRSRSRALHLAAILIACLLLASLPLAAQPSNHGPRATNHDAAAHRAEHGPLTTDHASPSWSDRLIEHLSCYPLAEARDVYKFTHQSVFGPAHAIPSKEGARRYLDEEIAALPPGRPDESPVDVLGDDPPLVRLNLRPWVAAGGDAGALVDAFVATAGRVKGDPQEMARRLDAAVTVLRGLGRGGDAAALAALASAQAEKGFPAVHHSGAYRAAYEPAYRVVSPELLEREQMSGAWWRPPVSAPAPVQPK
jgi:hypothetical protein